jgi:hypothetical protein
MQTPEHSLIIELLDNWFQPADKSLIGCSQASIFSERDRTRSFRITSPIVLFVKQSEILPVVM